MTLHPDLLALLPPGTRDLAAVRDLLSGRGRVVLDHADLTAFAVAVLRKAADKIRK